VFQEQKTTLRVRLTARSLFFKSAIIFISRLAIQKCKKNSFCTC